MCPSLDGHEDVYLQLEAVWWCWISRVCDVVMAYVLGAFAYGAFVCKQRIGEEATRSFSQVVAGGRHYICVMIQYIS